MNKKEELLNIFNSVEFEYEAQKIGKLCDRAKYYVISYLIDKKQDIQYMLEFEPYRPELTPIEQIFCAVYYQYINDFQYWRDENIETEIPLSVCLLEEFVSQKEIIYKDKKYVADFVLDFSRKSEKDNNFIYPELHNLKYVIELDGHSYHSNKAQMAYDYERENNLKEMGYTVIRFTGSQVYKEPYTCVDKLLSIIIQDIKR